MDFLDPDKQRAHIIRLFVGYILVAIAIAIATLILLFQSYGYDVDHHTGEVIQNGLVYVSSKPDSASVYLNGKLNKSRTNTKLTIPAGQYSIELRSKGYRSWKTSFSLDGGSVEQLTYPLLFPEKLVTTDVQLYSAAPAFATSSPDGRWLLVAQPGSLTTFDVFNQTNFKQLPTTLSLPADLLTASTGDQHLVLVEWADDNRHVLIKHTYDGASEFILVDRESPAESVNLNKSLAASPTAVSLRNKKFDQMYIYEGALQNLQTYDLGTKQLTTVLQKVADYKSRGNSLILYTTETGAAPGQILVKLWEGTASYTIHSFASTVKPVLDLAQYNGSWFVVVGPELDGRVYVYRNPQNTLKQAKNKALVPVTILKLEQPAYVSFASSGQYVVLQSGNKFAVYDVKTDRRYYYQLKQAVPVDQKAEWTDAHHLTLVLGGQTLLFDYDGTNQQALTTSLTGFLPYFARDDNGLYNIAPSVVVPGRFALTHTSLTLPD